MTSRSFRPSARETATRLMNTLVAERTCERLVVAYAHTLDFGRADQTAALFDESGVLEIEGHRIEGRTSIESALASLTELHGPTRHSMSSISVRMSDDGTGDGLAYLTLYGVGAGTEALLVGHVRDRFRADTSGHWSLVFRRIEVVARHPGLNWPSG